MPIPMSVGNGRALLNSVSYAVRYVYSFLDRFITPDDAPVTSPRTCEPGPGTITFTDTGNKFSIADGVLNFNGGTANAGFNDPKAVGSSIARANGRIFLFRFKLTSNGGLSGFGLRDTASAKYLGVRIANGSQAILFVEDSLPSSTTYDPGFAYATGQEYEFAIIFRSTGAFFLMRGGLLPAWTLLWVGKTANIASYYPSIAIYQDLAGWMDDWRVTDLSSPYNTDYGVANSYKAANDAGDVLFMRANAFIEQTVTVNSNDIIDLMARWQDDNNCWIFRIDQALGTAKLIEKVAGVEVSRMNATHTFTAGNSYRLSMRLSSTSIRIAVDNSAKATYSGASNFISNTLFKAQVAGTHMAAYPYYFPMPNGV